MQQQGFEILDVVAKPIRIRFSRSPGLAHPHVIRHDTATVLRENRDECAVQVTPRRISMDQHDWFTSALVHEVHLKAIHAIVVGRKIEAALKRLGSDVDHLRLPGCRSLPVDCGASGCWVESGRKYVSVWCVSRVPFVVTHSATP